MLIIFSGLPGSGKSTLATAVARRYSAVHIRIDTIEQAMRDAGHEVDVGGYLVGYAMAKDNLRLGQTVVADSVNPIPETRDAWRDIGITAGVQTFEIEVICGDPGEHQKRVEHRLPDIVNLQLPSWTDVQARDYQSWNRAVIKLDTAGRPVDDCVAELMSKLPQ